MVMEYIDGMNLDRYLQTSEGKQMKWMDILSILRDIASAMSYIHDNNVLHLDLRAANIIVCIHFNLLESSKSTSNSISIMLDR